MEDLVEKQPPADEVVDGHNDTDFDVRDMARMGKKQEFKRGFSTVASIAFTSCVMGTWEFVFINNFQSVVDGGRAGMFWSYLWVIGGQGFIVLSLAEMSSMAPTAGGQYHWVSEFAPRQYQKILSYTSGWLSSLCWQTFVSADCLFSAQLIMAMVVLQNPDYVVKDWQTALLAILVDLGVTAFNIFGARKLALVETIFVALHIAGFFIVLITLGATAPKQTAHDVFLEFYSGGLYPLTGLTVMVGQVSAMWNVVGSDAVAHLSEEVKDAGSVAPRAMFWSFFLNMPIALGMMIMFIFCLDSPESATTDVSFPFIWVLSQALSPAGVTGITAIMFILVLMIAISCYTSTARQCFAFARDGGFPFSEWLAKVNPKLNVPANSCLVTCGFTIIMALIYLGSSVAFNAIISLGIVALMATYGISIACVLQKRLKGEPLPPVRWSLGRWGILVNSVGLLYATFAFFWAFWPIYYQPTAQEFNFACVMFVGVMAIAYAAYFVRARKVYEGPVVKVEGRQVE